MTASIDVYEPQFADHAVMREDTVMIYCRLLIGRDGHLDQSEAYNIS